VASFFSRFTEIVNETPGRFKTLVISRPELEPPMIGNNYVHPWRRLRIEIADVQDDIRRLATVKLNELDQYQNHTTESKENLVQLVVDAAEGMMLWAFLVFFRG